jgi:hypothetical protein
MRLEVMKRAPTQCVRRIHPDCDPMLHEFLAQFLSLFYGDVPAKAYAGPSSVIHFINSLDKITRSLAHSLNYQKR